MHHLNGTLVPTSGSVRVGDMPVLPSTLRDVRRTVGMVFQDADDQLFMPTVGEDVAFGPANMGLPPEDVERRVHEALETVGALHLLERPPYRLSGGEKRMVSIATVLAMQPDILVMDEPTNHLDARARRNCIALLRSFKHARIIVSHDLDMVMDVCNRIIVLNQGRLVDGSAQRQGTHHHPHGAAVDHAGGAHYHPEGRCLRIGRVVMVVFPERSNRQQHR